MSASLPHDFEAAVPFAEPDDADRRLSTTLEHRGSAVVVHAHGEVDAYTLTTWRRLLREAQAATTPPGPIVIDTDGLDFMGCRSFLILAEESDRCRGRGVRLRLVSGKPIVARIVAAVELSAQLPIDSCLGDALGRPAVTGPPTGRLSM